MDCKADIVSNSLKILFVFRSAFYPWRESARANDRSGLHILPHGIHYRRIAIFDVSTQDGAAETRLASAPLMR
jgi:hypothetical protein